MRHALSFLLLLSLVLGAGSWSVTAVVMVAEPTPAGPIGGVQVDGIPRGMAISFDGIPYGNLPETGVFELPAMPAGDHIIGASHQGYESRDTPVTIPEGQMTRIRVELAPVPAGTLEVQSVPPGVMVFLDDAYRGVTPITLADVAPGDHTVSLRLAGYTDWSSPVTVVSGDRQVVTGTLEPVSATGQPQATQPAAGLSPVLLVLVLAAAMAGGVMISGRRKE